MPESKRITSKLGQDEWEQRFVDNFKPSQTRIRPSQELDWFRNILYYLGQQWIEWYVSQSKFGRRYQFNTDVPTPVTNLIRDTVKSKMALILNKNYVMTVWPNSAEQSDKDAAEVGQNILDHLRAYNDDEDEDIKEETALWTLLAGNVFPRAYPDMEEGGYIPLTDGIITGKGEIGSDVILPFNIVIPTLGTKLRRKPYVGIKTLVMKEWLEDTYKAKVTGSGTEDVDYQKELLTLVSGVSAWNDSLGTGYSDVENQKMTVVEELEYRPTKKYPRGQYAMYAGSQLLLAQDDLLIPTDTETGKWSYSVTHFRYDLVPGSFWATSAVDDLISPQRDVNEIDQALAVNRKSIGRPYIVTPTGLIMKRISARGAGVLAVEYNATAARGVAPSIQPGMPYPNQIMDERQNKMEGIQSGSGDPKNVLKGAQPSANASGTLFDVMRETAEQGHAPQIRRFYRNWKEFQRKKLILAQQIFTEQRLIKFKGKGDELLVKNYRGTDIRGNTDVRLTPDSSPASTEAGTKDVLLQLLQYKLWDETIPDGVRREFLKKIGLKSFPEANNIHRDRAEQENSQMCAGQFDNIAFPGVPSQTAVNPQTGQEEIAAYSEEPVIDPVFAIDDDAIHMQVHMVPICSREFKTFDKGIQTRMVAHYTMHEQKLQAKQDEMAQKVALLEAAKKGGNQAEGGGVQPAGEETYQEA